MEVPNEAQFNMVEGVSHRPLQETMLDQTGDR
jgi:hypothetical protein